MIPVRPENGAAVVRFRPPIFAAFGAPARCVADAAAPSCSSNRPKTYYFTKSACENEIPKFLKLIFVALASNQSRLIFEILKKLEVLLIQ